MNISFPVIELVDRYAIACIKFKKTSGLNKEELDFYKDQVNKLTLEQVRDQIAELTEIHEKIWDLESELKSGNESNLELEEIGKRAILIRNWNNQRIKIKNNIASVLNQDNVREFKKQHISE